MNFAVIAQPHNKLLQSETEDEEGRLNTEKYGTRRKRKSVQDCWAPHCEEDFQHLKRSFTESPVLAYADLAKLYELHMDQEGLGGVLYQEQDGGLRPIGYVIRSLTPSEKKHPVHKMQFLALKWAIIEKLRDYLYWATIIVKTDNNPLTYLLSTAKLNANGHRWLASLLGFQLNRKYRPGAGNRDADALSQRPHSYTEEPGDCTYVTAEGVRALCHGTAQRLKGVVGVKSIEAHPSGVPRYNCD